MLDLFFNKFTPDSIKQDPEEFARAKNMIGAAIIAIFAVPFYALLYYTIHHPAGAVAILCEGIILWLLILLLKYSGSLFWVRELFVGSLTVLFLWLTYSLGGIHSSVGFWFILPPLAAFFFGGIKPGIFSGICCAAAILFLYALSYFDFPIPSAPITHPLLLQMLSIIGLLTIILWLAYFFEKRSLEFFDELKWANRSEKFLKEKLITTIEQLENRKLALERSNSILEKSLQKQDKMSEQLEESSQSLRIQKIVTETERAAKSLLQNILESSIEYSIIATDLDGTILIWNEGAHRNYGYTSEEIVGKKNIKFLETPEDIKAGKSDHFFRTAYQNEQAESEWERVRKDNSRFLASVVTTLRRDETGAPIGYVIISRNITEHKKLENQLVKKNQELEQFAYMTSHDLKSPLRGIGELATWIEEDCGDTLDKTSKENLRLIKKRVTRMSNLISGILAYSRAGADEKNIHAIHVKHLLKTIIDNLNPPKSFTFLIHDLPTFQTDEIQLTQVFSNLIDNSIKHHPTHKGRIEIGFRELELSYEFFVKDDGRGIDPQFHDRIFKMFQTLKSKDELESTGIGLSIVKKIIEAHGGTIAVESTPGKGATFRFTWPKELG